MKNRTKGGGRRKNRIEILESTFVNQENIVIILFEFGFKTFFLTKLWYPHFIILGEYEKMKTETI